jgi:hypothetical protein
MKSYLLKLLLLATFAFWASGAAKYVHEALEHHGKDASAIDDDDSPTPAIALDTSFPQQQDQSQSAPKKKSPCPICQMLAAMVVDRSAPPVMPTRSMRLIDTLVLQDRLAPILHACLALSARGPPMTAGCIS